MRILPNDASYQMTKEDSLLVTHTISVEYVLLQRVVRFSANGTVPVDLKGALRRLSVRAVQTFMQYRVSFNTFVLVPQPQLWHLH